MDVSDFEQIVNTWYDPLYRFAFSLTRNTDDALDLTQSAFARYAEKGRHIRDPSRAKAWLFTVLYRDFISQRRRAWRLVFRSDSLPAGALEDLGNPLPGKKVDCAAALAALVELDEIYRAPLTLFYLQELSYREIADVLNLPIGTVMSRLTRGRHALRQALAGSFEQASSAEQSLDGRKHS